jgi:hypothetical protein
MSIVHNASDGLKNTMHVHRRLLFFLLYDVEKYYVDAGMLEKC